MPDEDQQRIDKWLWAARFYKTRGLAAEAVSGGKVHLNSARVKPSRNLKIGDQLKVTRGQYEFVITVVGLNQQRRPAIEAEALYVESIESIEKRRQLSLTLKVINANMPYSENRPSKKQRRQIVKFKRAD